MCFDIMCIFRHCCIVSKKSKTPPEYVKPYRALDFCDLIETPTDIVSDNTNLVGLSNVVPSKFYSTSDNTIQTFQTLS